MFRNLPLITTDQTIRAFKDRIKEIAFDLGIRGENLYQVLACTKPDPYFRFKYFFRIIARRNPDAALGYVEDLSAVLGEEAPHVRCNHTSLKEVHKECADVVNAGFDNASVAAQRREIAEARAKLRSREMYLDVIEGQELERNGGKSPALRRG